MWFASRTVVIVTCLNSLYQGLASLLRIYCYVAVGGLAFAGFPGEPFTDMGRGVRAASPFDMTMACCLVNGSQGYLPMYTAFAEGGYEATNSNFSAGVAEQLVAGQAKILKELYQD